MKFGSFDTKADQEHFLTYKFYTVKGALRATLKHRLGLLPDTCLDGLPFPLPTGILPILTRLHPSPGLPCSQRPGSLVLQKDLPGFESAQALSTLRTWKKT